MTFKNIAVLLDPTPEAENRAACAAAIARRSNAHLIGIHVVSAQRPQHRTDYYVRGGQAVSDMIASLDAEDEATSGMVRRRFDAIVSEYDLHAEFRIDRRVASDELLVLNSLHSDLVVVGQRELQELGDHMSPDRLLLGCGSPVLAIPDGWKSKGVGNRVLIGWNASREAHRAVTDALPFLLAAESVTVLVVNPDHETGRHGEEPGADIALHLARHGVRVDVVQMLSGDQSAADVMLSYANTHRIDLIVVGAYSHARSAEVIFGGVTRTLLKESTIPVMLSQ
jgi:nucleotide-binding universal stress UspA family protein